MTVRLRIRQWSVNGKEGEGLLEFIEALEEAEILSTEQELG